MARQNKNPAITSCVCGNLELPASARRSVNEIAKSCSRERILEAGDFNRLAEPFASSQLQRLLSLAERPHRYRPTWLFHATPSATASVPRLMLAARAGVAVDAARDDGRLPADTAKSFGPPARIDLVGNWQPTAFIESRLGRQIRRTPGRSESTRTSPRGNRRSSCQMVSLKAALSPTLTSTCGRAHAHTGCRKHCHPTGPAGRIASQIPCRAAHLWANSKSGRALRKQYPRKNTD